MGKLTLHARIEIGLALALLLGSCGENAPRGFTAGDHDAINVADVNSRNALYRVANLESRIDELSLDVADLRNTVNSNADVASSNSEIYNDFKDVTLDRLDRIEGRLGM